MRAFLVLIGFTICQFLAGMLSSNIVYYLLVYHMNAGDIVEGTKWKGCSPAVLRSSGSAQFTRYWMATVWANGPPSSLSLVSICSRNREMVHFHPGQPMENIVDPILCGPRGTAVNVLLNSMLCRCL